MSAPMPDHAALPLEAVASKLTPRQLKPSEVVLRVPPLHGIFGKAEAEWVAALIVRACQLQGDEWKAVTAADIGAAMRADIAAKTEPLASLTRNPFFRPDVWQLIERGFARWVGEPGGAAELLPHAVALIGEKHGRPS